jgi:hypothetical protein
MILLLIRVAGDNWQPSAIVGQFIVPDCSIWHCGDPFASGRGRVHKDTGFAFSLPDADSWVAALPLIRGMLQQYLELFQAVAAMGLKSELSIGVAVGEDESFAPSLDIPLELISVLHAAKVALVITAYPTSDE